MKALLDTNVLISAFLTNGLCAKLLLRANRDEFLSVTSPFILKEFRAKLLSKFHQSKDDAVEAAGLIEEISLIVDPKALGVEVKGVCVDRDDDAVLATAVAAEADFMVTGDAELLKIREFRSVRILSPREFEMIMTGRKQGKGRGEG